MLNFLTDKYGGFVVVCLFVGGWMGLFGWVFIFFICVCFVFVVFLMTILCKCFQGFTFGRVRKSVFITKDKYHNNIV